MEDILKHFAEALLPVFGALLTAFSSYAVTLVAKRLKIRLADEEQAMLRGAVRKAIAGAEEWAARKGKLPPFHCVGFFPFGSDGASGARFLRELAALTGGTYRVT